jgi:hypothetical protein
VNQVALVVLTNGRDDYLARTLESARKRLAGLITRRIILDDSGDMEHAASLEKLYGSRFEIRWTENRDGFGGACATLWSIVKTETIEPYVYWLEDDFTHNQVTYLDAMADVLDVNWQLSQLALRRQPWNAVERAAGGVVEAAPECFEDRVSGARRYHWLEHTSFWTTNPSLIPRRTFDDFDWPNIPQSEGVFSAMVRDAGQTFGYWGARASGTWVEHIGHERTGTGY